METPLNHGGETLLYPGDMSSPRPRLLGDLLVAERLITEAELLEALRIQREVHPDKLLGQILVDQNVVRQEHLALILARYHKKYRLGDILVETRLITEEQLGTALEHQSRAGLRLGCTLVKLNFLSEEHMKRALCQQVRATFVDLDQSEVDGSLAHLIDRSYAQQHLVIPVAKTERELIVAMDDPADEAVVEELESLTGFEVSVLTSTRPAFERAFTRVYGGRLEVETASRGSAGDAGTPMEPPTRDRMDGLALDDRRRLATEIEGVLGHLRVVPSRQRISEAESRTREPVVAIKTAATREERR